MKLKLLLAVALLGFAVFCTSLLVNTDKQKKLERIEVQSKNIDLKAHQIRGEYLLEQLRKGKLTEKEYKRLQEENRKYQEETEELKRQLQAKAEAKKRAAERFARAARAVSGTQKVYASANVSYGGSCAEWIAAAGIKEVAVANELIRRESGCNPYAINKSSGACGVAQELPCGKSGCALGDGACQVRWMNKYCLERYGSWSAALSHHDRNNWY